MQLVVLLVSHRKFCHITPVLKNLQWLPIDLRIEFKILIRLFMVSLLPTLKIFSKTTILHATLGLQRRIYSWSLCLTQIVMAVVLFLLLRRFFGTVFLSILEMLDHSTFFKDGLKLLFLYMLFTFTKCFWCFIT